VRATRVAAAVLGLALAGCAGRGDGEIFAPAARAAADDFVRAFVANGSPELARRYSTGTAQESLDVWHAYLLRDGVRTVEGPGTVRANCLKSFPVFAPPPPADCITYRLIGLMPVEGSPRTLVTTARFRVWLARRGESWRVSDFDYTPQIAWR
jgi:hypothetical protein